MSSAFDFLILLPFLLLLDAENLDPSCQSGTLSRHATRSRVVRTYCASCPDLALSEFMCPRTAISPGRSAWPGPTGSRDTAESSLMADETREYDCDTETDAETADTDIDDVTPDVASSASSSSSLPPTTIESSSSSTSLTAESSFFIAAGVNVRCTTALISATSTAARNSSSCICCSRRSASATSSLSRSRSISSLMSASAD